MRVVLITRNFPPRTCGVGDYASRMAEQLNAAGEQVTVLTEPAGKPRKGPVELCELPLGDWRDLSSAAEDVIRFAPDRVQLEYAAFAWSRRGAAWRVNLLLFRLRRRGFPVHVGLHEIAVSLRKHPLQVPFVLAQWLHVALIIAAAESVAVNMRSRAALLARLFPWWREKILCRPNSSTIPVVPLLPPEREAFRLEHGVTAEETVVATFGLFHPAKNYEALIQAVSIVRRTKPAKLWMLGDTAAASPEYIARLKHAAEEAGLADAIWWPGKLDAAEISRALQAADLFVLPQPDGDLTRSSAFMAAAAHGLPVVAIRQPGGRDQSEFTHGEQVWFVKLSTPGELAAGIGALAGDRNEALRIGSKLRELYAARFDWNVTLAGFRRAAALPKSLAAPAAHEFSGGNPT